MVNHQNWQAISWYTSITSSLHPPHHHLHTDPLNSWSLTVFTKVFATFQALTPSKTKRPTPFFSKKFFENLETSPPPLPLVKKRSFSSFSIQAPPPGFFGGDLFRYNRGKTSKTHSHIFPTGGWTSALVAALALLCTLLLQTDAGPMSLVNQQRLSKVGW